MILQNIYILASFLHPQQIGTNPESMFWLFPLAASIAIIYKTTKMPEITAKNFIKETIALFGSIIIFMAATACVLWVLARLILE